MFEEYRDHTIAAYAGYINDAHELLQCSSGGMATAMARQMLRRGGCVAGVVYSDDFMNVQYEIIRSEDQIDRLKGSKYVDADKNGVYAGVKALLDAGTPVLFFGLPCVVAALRAYLKQDYDHLIAAELVCHGPTSLQVHQQYIQYLQKKFGSRVVDFSVRKKFGAWNPAYLYARFENGRTFRDEFYHTEYGYAFSMSARPACYDCKFRGNARTGDIMIGDFWGAAAKDAFWNDKGVSAIMAHTEKGRDFLLGVEGVTLFPTTFERIVEKNRSIIRPRIAKPGREAFEKQMQERGLIAAARSCMGLKLRISHRISALAPKSFRTGLKKLLKGHK